MDDKTVVDLHLTSVRYTPNPKSVDTNASDSVLSQCEIVWHSTDGQHAKINLKKTLRECIRKVSF